MNENYLIYKLSYLWHDALPPPTMLLVVSCHKCDPNEKILIVLRLL